MSNSLLQKRSRGALPMHKLALPLIGEQFFRILVSSVDTFMLSSYSEPAVAGVGMMGQYVFFLQILFNVICIGSTIILAQYLGAQKSEDELNHVAKGGFAMTIISAFVLMLIVLIGTKPLLSCYTLEEEVRKSAYQYFIIFGGIGAPFTAFNMFQTGLLRTYGYTKETFIVTIVSNLVNVVGNAVAIYGFAGIPATGTAGVAAASVLSMIAGNILMTIFIRRKSDIQFRIFKSPKVPVTVNKKILSIGVPTAGESLSYNVAQIVIMAMISSLGTFAMNAQVYTNTIVRFVFSIAVAMGSAVQIKVGYYVGEGKKDTAYKNVFKYSLVATLSSVILILIVNLIKAPIIGIFTSQAEIAELTSKLLIFSIYIEFGRSLNLIYVGALKGAGDVKFPVFYGIFSMWGIMVLLSWFLGIQLHWGIIGCWLGIGTDETTRGIVMLFRWKRKRWQTKSIV